MKCRRFFFLCLLLLGGLLTSRAELVMTNFSATKLMKIMPIGDSITDDCSTNGAWRLFLQPLLQTNGYPFTFVGRQSSIASPPTFTKVNHEGYCGSVIAPPGYYGAHGYSATDGNLLKIVKDAMAITANRPDLVLLLIGANDIGRGRDPNFVATNDMPNLLGLIFSNAPSANIILAKITSLQDANILGYGDFATNVPIYNAALQAMVNQRRALGQNVFLADMYSVVDYNTMFYPDHVHPTITGLRAMANEWLARIQAITVRTNQVTSTLIHGGDSWKYSDTGQDLGTNWAQVNFDDSGWSSGAARLGYGDPATATTVSYGPDPANKYITTYFRHAFVVSANVGFTNLNFRLSCVDGAAVWLNGQEVFRTNLPLAGPLAYTDPALTSVTGFTSYIFFPTNQAVSALPAGTNLAAVEIHASSVTNNSLGFDLELLGTGFVIVPPLLSIQFSNSNVVLGWPANGGLLTLYSTTNLALAGGWSAISPVMQTNGGQITATISPDAATRYFLLQRP